jgi:hypothetical protein
VVPSQVLQQLIELCAARVSPAVDLARMERFPPGEELLVTVPAPTAEELAAILAGLEQYARIRGTESAPSDDYDGGGARQMRATPAISAAPGFVANVRAAGALLLAANGRGAKQRQQRKGSSGGGGGFGAAFRYSSFSGDPVNGQGIARGGLRRYK